MVLEYELLTSPFPTVQMVQLPNSQSGYKLHCELSHLSSVGSVRDLATGERYTYSVYPLPVVIDICVDLIAEVVLCFNSEKFAEKNVCSFLCSVVAL